MIFVEGVDHGVTFTRPRTRERFTAAAPFVLLAGTAIRMGAPPDPGLPEAALDLLRRLVRSDPAVQAAYPLAVAVGSAPVELVVGVEATQPGAAVAESFSARVMDADDGFRGLGFLDLTGSLLTNAQAAGTRLV